MAVKHVEDLKLPEIEFKAGETILGEGIKSSKIFILQSGKVKITAKGEELCQVDVKGAVFGELSVLLGIETSANVVAVEDTKLLLIEDAINYLQNQPELIFNIAQVLAGRLVHMNQVFVDMKHGMSNTATNKIKSKLYSWMIMTNNFFDRDVLNPFGTDVPTVDKDNKDPK
jgi:CRP-like cAMP-binding protein